MLRFAGSNKFEQTLTGDVHGSELALGASTAIAQSGKLKLLENDDSMEWTQ